MNLEGHFELVKLIYWLYSTKANAGSPDGFAVKAKNS